MIKFIHHRCLFFIVTLSSVCSSNFSSKSLSDDEKLMDELLNSYYQTMSDRNWREFRKHFWDNATLTTVWKRPSDSVEQVHVITIDEFIRETPNGPDSQPIFEERLNHARIEVDGNIAVVFAAYEAKFGSAENLTQWKGMDVFTWMKHNNTWRIVSLTFESER